MAAEIATKMDLVLYKLDNIESRLNSVYSSVANTEEALTNLEKDVADLNVKTEDNETDVRQLKEGWILTREILQRRNVMRRL